ncbi:ABC transporter permease [Ornithinimicrobium sp. F0845]|uniref:ABC transporter permease n=1 Tax=Ornithinimicrobium sp. F0845 TaxID=2926412 RepID=UPI001FF2514F|nr:ABC transporter permease [Ornithinimicrobium sp. F0845]MCK0112562.1 ABC transporter permease [Ornithinimicrobium sp. F0845]
MRYVLHRLAQSVVVLFGVTVVVFLIVHLVPGDPIRIGMGTRFDPEIYEALRRASGLDRPPLEQYVSYVSKAVSGDLGVSFRSGQPVTHLLVARLPATVSLAVVGILIALLVSFPLGIISAVRNGSAVDSIVRAVSQLGVSLPNFWLGMLLILLFSSTLGWLPPSGYTPITEDPVEWAKRVIMPGITVGVVAGSILTRYVRSSVLETLSMDHVRTADSKGLPRRLVLSRHVVRNALVPVITVTGTQIAAILGGVIVVEVVFAWPGLGLLVYDAVRARDYPLLQGAVLLIAVIFLVVNLIVDLLYAKVDPRIQLGGDP